MRGQGPPRGPASTSFVHVLSPPEREPCRGHHPGHVPHTQPPETRTQHTGSLGGSLEQSEMHLISFRDLHNAPVPPGLAGASSSRAQVTGPLLREACPGEVPFPTLAWLTVGFPSWAVRPSTPTLEPCVTGSRCLGCSPPWTVSTLRADTWPRAPVTVPRGRPKEGTRGITEMDENHSLGTHDVLGPGQGAVRTADREGRGPGGDSGQPGVMHGVMGPTAAIGA